MASRRGFRFFGESPSDWSEGAADGHLFSIQFERAPSDAELERIAEVYEQSLYQGPARAAFEAWHWSDRFASFWVGERWESSTGGDPAFVGAVCDFLVQASAIVPVVDAVFYGAHDDARAPQGTPDPGPDHGRAGCPAFQRPVDASLPPPAPSVVFETRRQAVRAGLDQAKIAQAIGKRKPGQVGLAPSSVKLDPTPSAPEWDAQVLAALDLAEGDRLSDCQGRPLAFIAADPHRFEGLAYLDDAAKRQQVQFPGSDRCLWVRPWAALNAAADRCLLIADQKAFEADLSSGQAKVIYAAAEQGTEPANVASYLPDGRVAVGTTKGVYLLDVAATVPRVLGRVAGEAGRLELVCDGRVLITGPTPRVIAYADGKLKRIGSFNTNKVWFAREQAGKVLFEGAGGGVYELTHLDEIYGKLARPKEKAAKKKTTTKRKVELQRVKKGSLPAAVKTAVPRETKARFKKAMAVITCPAGRVAAMIKGNLFGWGVQTLGSDDEVVDLTPLVQDTGKLQSLKGIALSDCGRRIYVLQSAHNIFAIDLEAEPPELEPVIQGQIAAHGPMMAQCPIGSDELFALGYTQLVWLRRGSRAWEQVATVSLKKATHLAVTRTAEGRPAAAAVLTDTKQRLQVFALENDRIAPLGKLADPVQRLEVRGSHLLACLSGTQLEVIGLPGQ